ncbi:unnamed protein product, partial [Nesidiocoris tenuis]
MAVSGRMLRSSGCDGTWCCEGGVGVKKELRDDNALLAEGMVETSVVVVRR